MQVRGPLSYTIIHLLLFTLYILKYGNEAEINIREVSIVSLASPEPCANELILHTYIYIKSAVIIDKMVKMLLSVSKQKSYVHSTKKF